jgi:hypothetical protein
MILRYLNLPPVNEALTRPTTLYEDNQSTIKIVNAGRPTERSRHINIQIFAIQDWRCQGHVCLKHIPGIINASDCLTKAVG